MALSVTTEPPQANSPCEIQEIIEMDVFHRFDVVSDSSDHNFVNLNTSISNKRGENCFTNLSSKVHKKIMQEWKILEKHLPDSIFVRVYENRIDLLRAAIVGAAGTPYHDGLYFFDIAFPSDYPARPPQVHYRSHGLRINPNLYANGRVCLSLLNTWTGKKCEKWNPNESTVLQVLVSIQALVLNDKPYFNEPGHVMWPGQSFWEKKSNSYNEDVFGLCSKIMLFVLRRPPKNFEDFVAAHFRERAHKILSAYNAYASGRARIGHYSTDGSSSSSPSTVEVSEKFKRLIAQFYPQLAAAFTRNGASLGILIEQYKEVENKTVSYKTQVGVKKKTSNGGVARRALGKLQKVLGLKKRSGKGRVKKKEEGNSNSNTLLEWRR